MSIMKIIIKLFIYLQKQINKINYINIFDYKVDLLEYKIINKMRTRLILVQNVNYSAHHILLLLDILCML